MKPSTKLILVKLLHTFIWVFFNVVIFYFLYAVIANKIDVWVWVCIALVAAEGLVLLAFRKMCPFTLVAQNYSNSTKPNFDIYLPEWLAKYNKPIYTTLFVVGLAVLVYRLVWG
jgi:hypothetical protein